MESIEKLREYAETKCGWGVSPEVARHIKEFANAIEQEVEDNERFRREAEPFHDRLCRAAEHREDVTLWGVEYMALPVDAGGEFIHVGDVMESDVDHLFDEASFKVCAIWLDEGGWEVVDSLGDHYNPDVLCHHHHAPTVEDVLEELLREYDRDDSELTNGEIIERFAAKLQLKER